PADRGGTVRRAVRTNADLARRVLVLAPTGRDAVLACRVLEVEGIESRVCADLGELCRALQHGAGAVLVAQEGLAGPHVEELMEVLEEQPAWSDLPVLVFAWERLSAAEVPGARFDLERLGNVTLLDRPIRKATLISAVHAALRARSRQYEVR